MGRGWKSSISRYSVMCTMWGVDFWRSIYEQLRDLEPQVGWHNRYLVIHDHQKWRKHGVQHRGYLHGYLLLLLFAWPAILRIWLSPSRCSWWLVSQARHFFFHLWHNKKICSQILACISPKIALSILLCWPTMQKINVGDMVVEVAASWQGIHCYWYPLNGILAKCTFILSSLLLLLFWEQQLQQKKPDTIWSNFIFTFTSIWQVELNFNQIVDDITKTIELYNHMIASNTFLRVLGKTGWENDRSQQILDGCLI